MIDKYLEEIDGKRIQKKYICVDVEKYNNNQFFKMF